MIIGQGEWRYEFQRDWAKLPRWWNLGETGLPGPPRTCVKGAVSVHGDVYVLSRSAHPVMVFDPDGAFITSWGEGAFSSFVHGLSIDREGKLWIADTGLHTVTRLRSKDQQHRITRFSNIHLGLPGADCFEQDHIHTGRIQKVPRFGRGDRQSSEAAACCHTPDEHAGIIEQFIHPYPVPEKRSPGERTGRIDRDNSHGPVFRAHYLGKPHGQRTLSNSRRAGDTDPVCFPYFRIK